MKRKLDTVLFESSYIGLNIVHTILFGVLMSNMCMFTYNDGKIGSIGE